VLGLDSEQIPLPQSDIKLQTPTRPIGAAAVSITQPISAIPTIRKQLGLLDIQKKLADEQTRLDRQTLIRDVRQTYHGIQSLQSSLKAANESVRLFREVERITSEYLEKRQVLDVDYLEAQLHLAKALESVLEVEDELETFRSKLNRQLGRAVTTEFTVSEISQTSDTHSGDLPDEASAARVRAFAQRPEVRQAQLRVEQARSEIGIASAEFNPSIAAEFVGIETTPVNSLLPRQVGIAGVGLTWEPFTWGRKKHEIALRREELEEVVNKQEEVKTQVEIDVSEQLRHLQLTTARLHVASLNHQVANESLRVAQKQYELQFSLLKAVLQAQTALEASSADYARSLSEVWKARAEYERALGDDQ
jgi:outer membrane protein TolC